MIISSIEQHQKTPNITLDDYVSSKRLDLGKHVCSKKRVYLDKRFWIIARDVERGEECRENRKKLISLLRERISLGEIICPISETIFFELYKQEDPVSRKQTINLIDEMSLGITLQPQPERVETEMFYLFHKLGKKGEFWPLENLVWSKISYIFGQIHPHNTAFDAETELAIQKAFFDYMWKIPLSEIERHIGGKQQPLMDGEKLAKSINAASMEHESEIRSFEGAYKIEMKGTIGRYMSTARDVLEGMYYKATGNYPIRTKEEKRQHELELLNFFNALIEKKKLSKSLRTLHIHAMCHATYRQDKNRRLKPNDFFDFHHASSAVGYCDVFLTEKTLNSLLRQKNLNLNKDFSCHVISDIDEALECIQNI